MANSRVDRRRFLAGSLASAPLFGTAISAGSYQAQEVPPLKGSRNSVVIPTHEFTGNTEERLDFPSDWKINVMEMAGHNAPEITSTQISLKLAEPVGTKPLRELAEGKRRVVITFDDLQRPTPTYMVVPWVLAELKAAGIADDNILFLGSFGTHRPMTQLEIQKKIGPEIVRRYAWMNHNCWDNLKDLGETRFKNKVRINQTFMAADLRVCLSGVKVHGLAGYGGGAKAILPGVAGLTTIDYNHNVVSLNNKTTGRVITFKNQARQDMIDAARLAKLDFTVQMIYNQRLRPTAVFSGDVVDAHHAAVRVANTHYVTKTFKSADIVVANGFPQCCQPYFAQEWIRMSVKEGGTGVLILQNPLEIDPVHFLNDHMRGKDGSSYFDLTRRTLDGGSLSHGPGNTSLIVYSQYLNRNQMNEYPRTTRFCDKWRDVVKILQDRHKGSVQVAVYPYAPLQHEEIELDG